MSEYKSKKQLLLELKELRQRIADLKAGGNKHRQAEEALRQSEEYSSTILNHSPNPIFVANPDSSVRYVNPAFETLTGFSLVELIGQRAPYPWWIEETLDRVKASFEEALRHGTKAKEELFQKKNGERFWVEVTATPVMVDGKMRYYLASWVDITEHKQVEEALRLRAQLLNEATDSIIATDLHGNLIYMNEATCRTRGYSKEEMLNINLQQLVPSGIANLVDERLRRIQKEGTIVIESEHVRQDGSIFPVETTSRTVNLGDRTIILSVIRDITSRKKAEETLKESEEKFSRAFQSNPHPMSIVTLDEGRYLDVNDSYVRTFGFSREE
ncbi:MAG TPA: PAS domain S-box protein, partial [Dehalococcoidales bacterium]|nr:PAS domain S-box protein [Dehalococcoidales bacterium]